MSNKTYFLGLDIGSSSIKAAILDYESGQVVCQSQSPETELTIEAPQAGWAEQDPDTWWEHTLNVLQMTHSKGFKLSDIKAIGISYQMHGLVAVGKDGKAIRSSIIWCDSRAAGLGESAFQKIGPEECLSHCLNNPGNFTAAKLAWVKNNEPENYSRIHKIMLPGDYIAMRLSNQINTTITGLSEGVFWDFPNHDLALPIFESLGINTDLIPEITSVFGIQAEVSREAASQTGLSEGTPICYRAGDQPNNAFSLKVLEPGELAATAGTSGVIYGILDQFNYDPSSRVNLFAHVNHQRKQPRLGVLLCVNGTGIQYSWIRNQFFKGQGYHELNLKAAQAPVGSDGLMVFPFGNGVERIFQNRTPGAAIQNIDFNRHQLPHILRSLKEGIVYALNYGFEAMREMGVQTTTVRAGSANLFMSPLFAEIFSNVTQTSVELFDTDGAAGAARAAGLGAGFYNTADEALSGLKKLKVFEPSPELSRLYQDFYELWKTKLLENIN